MIPPEKSKYDPKVANYYGTNVVEDLQIGGSQESYPLLLDGTRYLCAER
jgi:hypothetical protein